MNTWSDIQSWFAAAMPGYEPRAEQDRLATAVENALEDGQRLLAQAGCGTGKSFGALGPAICWAVANGETVVVSTATKALQTQYATKDLPFLAELFAANGMPFRFSVLKGRGNYACRAKLAELDENEIFGQAQLIEELELPEASGDLDDLLTEIDFRDRSKLVSTSDECPGKNDCVFGEICFAEQAKRNAREAHIVVVNHAFLITDAQVREVSGGQGALLPNYRALVVDEAHELEDYATNCLGDQFTERGLLRYATEMARWFDDEQITGPLVGRIKTLFGDVLPEILGRKASEKLTNKLIARHGEALVEVHEQLTDLVGAMNAVSIHGDDRKIAQRKRLRKRGNNLRGAINAVVSAEADELVRWVETETRQGQKSYVLRYAPLHVGPFLDRAIWNSVEVVEEGIVVEPSFARAVVCMSATLTTGSNDFTFVARALGLDKYTGFDAGSPFDFASQAAIYVPKARTDANPRGFADPSRDTELWRTQAQQVTKALVRASGGRALLLFTSRSAMVEAYEALADDFVEEGLTVLIQDGQTPNRQLAETFRADETSVLFALKSFMTGADFQGRTLQLVIVDKMPFPVPTDPIFAARAEAADKRVAERYGQPISKAMWHREGSFNGMMIPSAILTLAQAVGRGVRTKTDHALLAVLDPRLNPASAGGKKYGPTVLSALPPARRLGDLPSARDYLASLDELSEDVFAAGKL